MKKLFWMSYDLGLKGDYEGLYYWLDLHKARECGNSIAAFWFNFKNDPVKELLIDLKRDINFKEGDRVYIIWRDIVNKKSRIRGKFLMGKRKRSPWEGFAPGDHEIKEYE